MKIIDQSYTISLLAPFNIQLKQVEDCGRVAYASEDKIAEGSSKEFAKMIMGRNHGAVIEHSTMTVKFITDRGVSHELVRHRLASFTQESTRYCSYDKNKFGNEITVIRPSWFDKQKLHDITTPLQLGYVLDETTIDPVYFAWVQSMLFAEEKYLYLRSLGQTAQEARTVLPNSLKTKIAMTTNFREWLHVFKLRAVSKAAHPQMRDLMIPLYNECRTLCPEIFDLGDPE